MPPQKRIQHLRSKNKLLLDKLESHSSLIDAEIKHLKRTIRGTSDKTPSCNETRFKNWAKRNNSLQVTEALSSCTKPANDCVSNKSTFASRGKNRNSTNVECEDEIPGSVIEVEEAETVCHPSDKEKRTACKRLKLIHRRKSGDNDQSHNSKSIREIVASIDYSPKSTFVKRMKSKCKPFTREVYVRLSKEAGGYTTNVSGEKEARTKKKRQTRGPGETPIQKTRHSDVLTRKKDHQTSYRKPLCSDCGKIIASQTIACTCEDESLESEELSKCGSASEENEELERLKNFRRSNWQDCHAESSKSDSFHCCSHHKCNKVYGINDRLFAVPLDGDCENPVHCPFCPHIKCQQSCCANSKQVIVTIPATLLESSALDASKENLKAAKKNIPVSKDLLKKLQRPVPNNSMALRYQKGVC